MMKLPLATVAFLLIALSACDRDDDIVRDNGVVVRQKPLWSAKLSEDLNVANISILTPIIYNESNFLVGSIKDGQRSILSIDAEDGNINWEWSDLMGLITNPDYKDPIHMDRRAYYLYNNKLFFNYSTSSYCVDLKTGTTIWKNKIARSRFSNNAGIDDVYFSAGSEYEVLNDEKIYWGSVNSSAEEQLLLRPDYTQVENPPPLTLGFVNSMRPFKHGNDMYLAFGIENPYSDFGTDGMGLTELNLYNLTQSKYEYKKIVTNAWKDSRGINDMFYKLGICISYRPTISMVMMQ
ncbi:MAG: hypothetical protein QM762_23500 [Chryseolinea sp.]